MYWFIYIIMLVLIAVIGISCFKTKPLESKSSAVDKDAGVAGDKSDGIDADKSDGIDDADKSDGNIYDNDKAGEK